MYSRCFDRSVRLRGLLKIPPINRRACLFLHNRCLHSSAASHADLNTDYQIPKTPEGSNPYVVFNIDPVISTTESIAKRHKQLVINNHPDRPGGSHEKMLEINAANDILRKHHTKYRESVLRGQKASKKPRGETFEYEQMKDYREERFRTTGGVPGASTSMDPTIPWNKYIKKNRLAVTVMVNRYDLACRQGLWMRKHKCLAQLIARERWLVKGFLSNIKNELSERKKYAHSSKRSETLEDIESFSVEIEETLNGAFNKTTSTAELKMKMQTAVMLARIALGFIAICILFDRLFIERWVRNSYANQFKEYFT